MYEWNRLTETSVILTSASCPLPYKHLRLTINPYHSDHVAFTEVNDMDSFRISVSNRLYYHVRGCAFMDYVV